MTRWSILHQISACSHIFTISEGDRPAPAPHQIGRLKLDEFWSWCIPAVTTSSILISIHLPSNWELHLTTLKISLKIVAAIICYPKYSKISQDIPRWYWNIGIHFSDIWKNGSTLSWSICGREKNPWDDRNANRNIFASLSAAPMELRSILRNGQCWHVLTCVFSVIKSRWIKLIKRHTQYISISLPDTIRYYQIVSDTIRYYQILSDTISMSVYRTWTHIRIHLNPDSILCPCCPALFEDIPRKDRQQCPKCLYQYQVETSKRQHFCLTFHCGGPTNLESVTISVWNRAANRISGPCFAQHPHGPPLNMFNNQIHNLHP